MLRRIVLLLGVGSLSTMGLAISATSGSAVNLPSGQVIIGNATPDPVASGPDGYAYVGGGATVEPAYNLADGSLLFLSTPVGAQPHPTTIMKSNGFPANVAPPYITVYPVGSGIVANTLNCTHLPADNCPDHGIAVAGLAVGTIPAVYGGGVFGHDHLAGLASTKGDFNVLWEPTLILFKTAAAAKNHITTQNALNEAVNAHRVMEVALPFLGFNCAPVSAAVYAHGTVVSPIDQTGGGSAS